jgi:hypothetical protein
LFCFLSIWVFVTKEEAQEHEPLLDYQPDVVAEQEGKELEAFLFLPLHGCL